MEEGYLSKSVEISEMSGMAIDNPFNCRLKRLFDLLVLMLLLPITIPLILFISIIIKLTSKGPVIFTQYRVGKGGKLFKIYKFRTMHINAEETLQELIKNNPEIHQEWKTKRKLKNDPRITRIGKFLRKTSLDELPQFLNVLKGQMSIIGPRPYLPSEIEDIGEKSRIILSVNPGITGLWQVNGRSNTTFRHRINLDCFYVKNWSIWLDILIMLKTVKVVIKCDGAY